MNLEGPGSSAEGQEFNECLRCLTDQTLLVLEVDISAHIGPRVLCEMASRFLGRQEGPRSRSPLWLRLEAPR